MSVHPQARWSDTLAVMAVGFELGLPPLAILTLAAIVILSQDLDSAAGVPAPEVADLVVRGSPSVRPAWVPQALRDLVGVGLVRIDGDGAGACVTLLVDPQAFPFSERAIHALEATTEATETGTLDQWPPYEFQEVH